MEELKRVNTKKARAEFEARKSMEKEATDKIYGAAREEARRIGNGGADFTLFNYVMSVHSFKSYGGTELIYAIYRAMMTHVHRLERNAELMASCFTDEQLKELDIERDKLIPTKYCKVNLEAERIEARRRAKMSKYFDYAKEKKIYTGKE